MEITMAEKINRKLNEIWKAGLVPRGNLNQTLSDLVYAIELGNVDGDYFWDEQEAEAVAREIYENEIHDMQLTDNDFQQIAKMARMIPLDAEDEDRGWFVMRILFDSYVIGKNRVNAFFAFLPEEMQKADRTREDLEITLDWVDDINSLYDHLVFVSHDRAEKEICYALSFYDREGTLFSEADITALVEIMSHLMIAEVDIDAVAYGLVHSYHDILSPSQPLDDDDDEWWKTELS